MGKKPGTLKKKGGTVISRQMMANGNKLETKSHKGSASTHGYPKYGPTKNFVLSHAALLFSVEGRKGDRFMSETSDNPLPAFCASSCITENRRNDVI